MTGADGATDPETGMTGPGTRDRGKIDIGTSVPGTSARVRIDRGMSGPGMTGPGMTGPGMRDPGMKDRGMTGQDLTAQKADDGNAGATVTTGRNARRKTGRSGIPWQ